MIRILPANLINQIAAGEVVERPSSVIKELVENSLDAGATSIEITVRDGGKTYISIADNGHGMSKDDLEMCVERHATSKIPDLDLFKIQSFGFRGEALPSIGSVSRLSIASKHKDSSEAWIIHVEGGEKKNVEPIALTHGTKIQVSDLFYATPARLKFLKSTPSELSQIVFWVNQIAMAHPTTRFILKDAAKVLLEYHATDSHIDRIKEILSNDFTDNSCRVDGQKDDISIHGWVSLPTYNRGNTQHQYFYLNNRPVTERVFSMALKIGFQDYIPSGRYPFAVLFLTMPMDEVDINVHPAKLEVRFRHEADIRSFLIGSISMALSQNAQKTSTTLGTQTLAAFTNPFPTPTKNAFLQARESTPSSYIHNDLGYSGSHSSSFNSTNPIQMPIQKPKAVGFGYHEEPLNHGNIENEPIHSHGQISPHLPIHDHGEKTGDSLYLGVAVAQIENTYIIARTNEQLILIDQHAAHERITYEGLKSLKKTPTKPLLIPEIITIGKDRISQLELYRDDIMNVGFSYEAFGLESIAIKEVPSILDAHEARIMMQDLIDALETGAEEVIHEHINRVLADVACRSSIRAGQKMNMDEMNALIHQMESTPNIAQCNHGRPTYIQLSFKDINRLFERS
jgi:DNA mismatch repair protein MutL